MRYIAKVNNTPDVIRVMIHSDSDGSALLYIFDSPFDGACTADYWFASVDDAAECAAEDYGVKASDWFDGQIHKHIAKAIGSPLRRFPDANSMHQSGGNYNCGWMDNGGNVT